MPALTELLDFVPAASWNIGSIKIQHQYIKILRVCVSVCLCVCVSVCLSVSDGSGMFVGRD